MASLMMPRYLAGSWRLRGAGSGGVGWGPGGGGGKAAGRAHRKLCPYCRHRKVTAQHSILHCTLAVWRRHQVAASGDAISKEAGRRVPAAALPGFASASRARPASHPPARPPEQQHGGYCVEAQQLGGDQHHGGGVGRGQRGEEALHVLEEASAGAARDGGAAHTALRCMVGSQTGGHAGRQAGGHSETRRSGEQRTRGEQHT